MPRTPEQHPRAAQPASSRARAGRPPAPLGRRGRLRPPKPTPAPPRRPPGWGAAVHRPLAERGLACSYTLLGGVVSPRRVMARDRRSSQRRRAGGRGRGRGGKRFKRPARTAEDRESGRNQRKKPSWAWRVVFLSLLEGKSQCEIQRIFKAEEKAVSRYYIQSCLADYDAYGNPDHRNEVGAFRIESLGPAQSAWLKELLLKTPDLFFFEIETQFVRQCVRTTPLAAYATYGLWIDTRHTHIIVYSNTYIVRTPHRKLAGRRTRCDTQRSPRACCNR